MMEEQLVQRRARNESVGSLARREVLIGGSLLALAGATNARLPRTPIIAVPGSIQSLLPKRFGEWTSGEGQSFVLPPEDERKAAATYDEQVTATYRHSSGATVMLLIAYARSQSGMLMVHRPESCYPGAGFKITGDRPARVPLARDKVVSGRFISAEQLPRVEQVLYWTRLGNDFVDSWDDERESLAKQNLRGFIPDGALIRASAIATDEAATFNLLVQFAAGLYAASGFAGKALLGGPANAA